MNDRERLDDRARSWQLRTTTVRCASRPLVMGIINVTPDSFSDGGKFFDRQSAITLGLRLVEDGADLLDIGGESTRPYSTLVDASEELRRVVPVVEELCQRVPIPVSVDTSKAVVARRAVAAGAEIVNDITGLEGDPEMLAVVRELAVGVCVMHMQGTPQTMQDNPTYDDVVGEISDYLAARRDAIVAAGIECAHICLDPGIGFGKSHEHNLTLLSNCRHFHRLGCPILVGHSRKGFIGTVLGDKNADRTAGTVGVALAVAQQGIQVIRVHEVKPIRAALRLFEASGGLQHVS